MFLTYVAAIYGRHSYSAPIRYSRRLLYLRHHATVHSYDPRTRATHILHTTYYILHTITPFSSLLLDSFVPPIPPLIPNPNALFVLLVLLLLLNFNTYSLYTIVYYYSILTVRLLLYNQVLSYWCTLSTPRYSYTSTVLYCRGISSTAASDRILLQESYISQLLYTLVQLLL